MTESFKIRISDLLPEFFTHADILRHPLQPAGTIAAICRHHRLHFFNNTAIFIKPDIIRQLKLILHVLPRFTLFTFQRNFEFPLH